MKYQWMMAVAIGLALLIGVGLVGFLLLDGDHESWEEAQLLESSKVDEGCIEEVENKVATILAGAGLGESPMRRRGLEMLIDDGQFDQFVNLYGGDEVRHWTFARFEDQRCAIYNHAVTEIDLSTQQKEVVQRPVGGRFGEHARLGLEKCECVDAQR